MVDKIEGSDHSSPINPQDVQLYKKEYEQGVTLFQKALQQYSKSDNPYQQKEFQKVMDKAMQILNETASSLGKEDINEEVQENYTAFNQAPKDPQTISHLQQSLNHAKNALD